jgi:hypothetical protein
MEINDLEIGPASHLILYLLTFVTCCTVYLLLPCFIDEGIIKLIVHSIGL